MNPNGIQIQSYEYLGLNYVIKLNNTRYKLFELSEEQLNWLIDCNQRYRDSREFADEMIYIFNDVKRIRRKEKLKKIYHQNNKN